MRKEAGRGEEGGRRVRRLVAENEVNREQVTVSASRVAPTPTRRMAAKTIEALDMVSLSLSLSLSPWPDIWPLELQFLQAGLPGDYLGRSYERSLDCLLRTPWLMFTWL